MEDMVKKVRGMYDMIQRTMPLFVEEDPNWTRVLNHELWHAAFKTRISEV